MTIIRAGEIWLARIEYTDGTGAKPRPVLSLFSDGSDSVFCVVTSAAPRGKRDLPLNDWQAAGLRLPSTVRLDRLVTMSVNRLWSRLGVVSDGDWNRVANLGNEQMRLSFR